MSTNVGSVFAGVGQDLVTGTVLSAPYGTPLPVHTQAFFEASLDGSFLDAGYIGEPGVTLAQGRSFNDIKDMDGTIVDSVQTGFDGTIQTNFLELNSVTLANLMGDANVVVTSSTTTAGNRYAVTITGEDLNPKSWVFRMKSGAKRAGIVIPNGRLTDQGNIAFTSSGAASVDATIKMLPYFDSVSGLTVHCWLILDDGVVALSLVPTISSALPSGAAAAALITIRGTRFTGVTGATHVTIGGVNAAAYTVVNDTTIVAEMPAGSAGSAPIIVTNTSGASAAFPYTRT